MEIPGIRIPRLKINERISVNTENLVAMCARLKMRLVNTTAVVNHQYCSRDVLPEKSA
jgi:hypothetical protein